MCTMTWFVKQDGYELFFNRDERGSRSRAAIPGVRADADVQVISPTDADAGGSWISVNQYGVTVCLLNHYEFEQIATYKNWISRGQMVRQFEMTSDIDAAAEHFLSLQLQDYRAFRMFIIDHSGSNRLCIWDGHQARVEHNVSKPKSSSAVDAKHVKQVRKQLFDNLGLASSTHSEDYLRFHASHLPAKSQESVCMHREDASTVSLSYIDVDSSMVQFRYSDGPPCTARLSDAVIAPRIPLSEPEKIVAAIKI